MRKPIDLVWLRYGSFPESIIDGTKVRKVGSCHRSVPNLLATKFLLLGTYNLRRATSKASRFGSAE